MFARQGHRVAAIDSDPMPGLAISLGLGPRADAMLADAVEKDSSGRWRLKRGVGPATAITRYSSVAPDGVRLLQFGKATTGGLQPVMGSLNGLYQAVHRLAKTNVLRHWTVIGDLPAGPRQTAFDWAPYADALVVVVEPTWASVLTAKRIVRIARSRENSVEVLIAANKVTRDGDVELIQGRTGERIFEIFPLDPAVAAAERAGGAPMDHAPSCPYVRAVEAFAGRLKRHMVGTGRDGNS